MLKIISNCEEKPVESERLGNGEIVFMKGSHGTGSFYGICIHGIGVIELENGSTTYASTKEQLYVGSAISYWTVGKVYRNCELIIKE